MGAQPEQANGAVGPYEWEEVRVKEEAYAPVAEAEHTDSPTGRGSILLAGTLILLAAAWTGAAGWTIYQAAPAFSAPEMLNWIAIVSAPLILLGLAWLLFGRSSRRETERFTNAIAHMRAESQALESLLAIVAARIEENRAQLTHEAGRLMALGDEASDRLGRVTHYLARESSELERRAQALDAAAAAAKVDVGVLLHDLPRAEEQARAVAEAMREAGLAAHGQAGALESQLSALAARGREADETVGGAAQRLGAHLARIESTTAAASERMDEAGAGMKAAVDGAMAGASDAIDAARAALEAQAAAMLAAIEQSRALLDRAGADASRKLAERLDTIGERIEALASQLSSQDAASHSLLSRIDKELGELDERFARLGASGGEQSSRLSQAIDAVRASAEQMRSELEQGQGDAGALIERAGALAQALDGISDRLGSDMPETLSRLEEHSARASEAAEALVPVVNSARSAAESTAASLSESESVVARQRDAVEALLERLGTGAAEAETQLEALAEAVRAADGEAGRLVSDTGPELINALVRVREAAQQAAIHARDAIGAVIPESVGRLAEASREAVGEAMTAPVEERIAELSILSDRAVGAARKASERLTRQLLTIGETAAAIENRISEARKEREEQEAEGLPRRVSLLIESLNSTAIDVTKILSNEVTDSAWAAYLKGDRGVFTRRAVRLLDSGEAREILRHYEEEPEFREQVNRYIHDFEAMLRRILADRDGSALGVTLLSSDMGKLYIALAQAIERLRK